jgi:ABC-2 type transport system permease protein
MSTTDATPTAYDVAAIVEVAVAPGERPPRPPAVSTSLTFAWRALLKIRHVPEQLLDVTVFPVMFLLMFTYLFGGAVAGSTGAYLQQVVPGILVMQVAWISMYTGHTLNRDITKGVHDRFRSLPIWQPSTLVGPLLADSARYTMASTVILGLGYVLGFRPGAGLTGLLLGIAVLLVFSFSLSWIWTTVGLLLRSENAVFSVGNMVMFPLTFVSNVFVPTESLPGWLQGFVRVNPITLVVTSVRGFVHGEPQPAATVAVLVVSAALVVVFGPLTMWLYRHPR